MNKWEYKYQWETAAAQVENLIDINGKNTHHIQELYADLKKKDEVIDALRHTVANLERIGEENIKEKEAGMN